MKKLENYIKKNGIEYQIEQLGSSYFKDDHAQLHFNGVHVTFDYSDIPEQARHTVQMIEKITRYCKRYGYTIFSRYGWYGVTTFRICKASDYEKLEFLNTFVTSAIDACKKDIHLRHKGFYTKETDAEFNERLAGIMEFWQDEYLETKKAIAATA